MRQHVWCVVVVGSALFLTMGAFGYQINTMTDDKQAPGEMEQVYNTDEKR